MIRNAAWFAARTIAQMDPNERAAFDAERSSDGWRATIEKRLQHWPTEFMGPTPTADLVLTEMERLAFRVPGEYRTRLTFADDAKLGRAGYTATIFVGRHDGERLSDADRNRIEEILSPKYEKPSS